MFQLHSKDASTIQQDQIVGEHTKNLNNDTPFDIENVSLTKEMKEHGVAMKQSLITGYSEELNDEV